MDSIDLSTSQMANYSRRPELIRLTAQQIQKDFGLAGFEITFSGNGDNAYNELFQQILPVINKLINFNYEKLLQLLYSIDVSEPKIKSELNTTDEPYPNVITRLIIYRELQKVVTRIYFKEKGSDF